eukprot:TRINITY_DN78668_c0_g1_i1.p1 TRINITY_DN78668_c0_g1~~TRINITY_DN78668_c0_g1_i1.p1  ORF type:complete len:176 (+),score=48.07 TRINITY_DN78668_c0_g1_i1:37-528(+)
MAGKKVKKDRSTSKLIVDVPTTERAHGGQATASTSSHAAARPNATSTSLAASAAAETEEQVQCLLNSGRCMHLLLTSFQETQMPEEVMQQIYHRCSNELLACVRELPSSILCIVDDEGTNLQQQALAMRDGWKHPENIGDRVLKQQKLLVNFEKTLLAIAEHE